jgi:hypothetical protein
MLPVQPEKTHPASGEAVTLMLAPQVYEVVPVGAPEIEPEPYVSNARTQGAHFSIV